MFLVFPAIISYKYPKTAVPSNNVLPEELGNGLRVLFSDSSALNLTGKVLPYQYEVALSALR